jgi:hypothetical protein
MSVSSAITAAAPRSQVMTSVLAAGAVVHAKLHQAHDDELEFAESVWILGDESIFLDVALRGSEPDYHVEVTARARPGKLVAEGRLKGALDQYVATLQGMLGAQAQGAPVPLLPPPTEPGVQPRS